MTLNELAYSIREGVKEYQDDSELDDEYIFYLVGITRAVYLKQRLNQLRYVGDLSMQQTICVPLEVVSEAECGETDCKTILRSTIEIPDVFQLSNKPGIVRVGPTSRLSRGFNFVTREKAVYASNSKFPNEIHAFLHDDNRMYLTSQRKGFKLLDCISVSGIFEDPLEVAKFQDCCNCPTATTCFNPDVDEYPIPPELVKFIRQDVINELLVHKDIPEDKQNNAND